MHRAPNTARRRRLGTGLVLALRGLCDDLPRLCPCDEGAACCGDCR
jgi:hypothetical protein